VATAAFGLGIDADEIRTIIHACLPETADRWYQEVGRAGRDGYASTAMLVPAFGDKDEALSLGVRVLTPDVALARWDSIWTKRRDLAGRTYVNLGHAPPRTSDGSYNRTWNAQILDGLGDLGVLKRTILSWDEARQLGLSTNGSAARLPDAWQEISLQGPAPDASFFRGPWTHWKNEVERSAFASVAALENLVQTQNACATIESAYRPSPEMIQQLGSDAVRGFGISAPCGRCQACRRMANGDQVDPAPNPSIRWASTDPRSAFAAVVDGHVFGQGSAVGVLDRTMVVETDASDICELVPVLVTAGVRLGAGQPLLAERLCFPYFDEVPDPLSMQPIPAVLACEHPSSLRELLELLRLRAPMLDGRPGPVLVQVSEIPRDLRSQRPLTAADLRSLLEER
jgi:hypothetical protein